MQAATRSPGRGLCVGEHSTQCHGGVSLYRRHDRLKMVLYAALRSGGYSPQLEPPHLIPSRLTRPGDIYVPVGDNGYGRAYDVTVESPLLGPTLVSTARTLVTPTPPPSSAKLPSTPAFALLKTCDSFRWLRRHLEVGLAWRRTRFSSLRTAKRTALEHRALCAVTPIPCTFCCHSEKHRSGYYRPVRSTPRKCPPFVPCPS
jgi:hypothetical protein